jgi:hypothetical protein
MEFLRAYTKDWVALVSSTLSFILFFAIMFMKTPPAELMCWVGAYVFLAIAAYRLWRNEHRASLAEKSGKELREGIVKLLWEGQELMATCAKDIPESLSDWVVSDVPKHAKEAEDWKDRAEALLETRLDFSYVARFRDPTHVPVPDFKPGQPAKLMAMIYVRVFRLGQFLAELASAPTPAS